MHNMLNKKLTALTFAVVLAAPAVHATNGMFSHGYGTKNKGLAGGGAALPQDAMIMATNPAGLVDVGERIDIGLAIFAPSRGYKTTGPLNPGVFDLAPGSGSHSNIFFIPSFAWSKPINDVSSFGISLYGNGGMNTDYSKSGNATLNFGAASLPGVYGGGKAGIDYSQLFINFTYAHKIGDSFSIGISGIVAGQRIRVKGLGNFAPFSNSPANLSNNGYDYSYGGGGKIGLQWKMSQDWSMAASWQSKMYMSKFDGYKGLLAEKGDMDIASTATFGLAWNPGGTRHTLVADYQYIWYNDIDAIGNDANGLLFVPGSCALGNPSLCLGGSNGAGFGWDNMGIIKLGYQFQYSEDLQLRGGWSYGSQPIRGSQAAFNVLAPATIEQHFTLGLTRKFGKSNELNVSAMYAPRREVHGSNAFATFGALPPVVQPLFNQDVDLYMSQFEIEAGWSWIW